MVAREYVPIHMEAAKECCWRLCERLGFVTLQDILLGKRKGCGGWEGVRWSSGVRIWGMIWRLEMKG